VIRSTCVSEHADELRLMNLRSEVPIRERSIVKRVSICLSVHMTCISQKRHAQTVKYPYMLPIIAVARSSSGGVTIRYVLPILWMLSRLHIMAMNRQCEKGVYLV